MRVTLFYLTKRKLEKHEDIYLEFHSLFSNFGINFRNYIRSLLSKVSRKKDQSIGCIQYRQMFELSQESHIINPDGKKWVRESMAAQGLMKKYKCTPVESRIRIQ